MTAAAPGGGAPPSDLVSRLGLAADARAIILNADDYGMCRAANRAVSELLLAGHIDSATVTLGPLLEFDNETEQFVNNDPANHLVRREDRKPFVVPQVA